MDPPEVRMRNPTYLDKIHGELTSFFATEDELVITTRESGEWEIMAFNDCCGSSKFCFPEGFDEMAESCKGLAVSAVSFCEVDDLDTEFSDDEKPGRTAGPEQENILFRVEFAGDRLLHFGLRSYHNGYYPVSIWTQRPIRSAPLSISECISRTKRI